MVFNTGPYTVLPDNSILIIANMQSQMGFPSSHKLKSYVASKSRLKLAARAVLSADAGLLVVNQKLFFPVSVGICVADMCSAQSADAVRKDATLSSTQQNFILNLASCLVSMRFT